MTKRDTVRLILTLAILLIAMAAPAAAQSESVVYTNEELKKRLDESEGKAPAVFTNDDLKKDEPASDAEPVQRAEPVSRAQPASAAFTNDDLRERFGDEEAEATAALAEAIGEAPPADAAQAAAEPDAEPAEPAEPVMSDAERRERIAEIDAELARLEKRLLAIHNPLLAGTVPSTAEEKETEVGMDNQQRLQSTRDTMDELRRKLDELGQGDQ